MSDELKSIGRRLVALIRMNKKTNKAIKQVDSEINKIQAKENILLMKREETINKLHKQERIIVRLVKRLKGKG